MVMEMVLVPENSFLAPPNKFFTPHHGTDWCDCLTKLRSTVHLNIDEPPFRHKSPTLDKCVNLKADLCRGGSIVGRVSALWAFNKTRIYNYMTAYITEVNKEKVFQIISDAPNWQRFEIRMTVFPFLPPPHQKKIAKNMTLTFQLCFRPWEACVLSFCRASRSQGKGKRLKRIDYLIIGSKTVPSSSTSSIPITAIQRMYIKG